MKTLVTFLLSCTLTVAAFSQPLTFSQNPGPQSPTKLEVQLPPLVPMTSHNGPQPFHRLLYVMGDGNFILDTIHTDKDSRVYQYQTNNVGITAGPLPYTARLYSVNGYSGGGEPPQRLISGQIPAPISTPGPPTIPFTSVVPANRYLRLIRNADAKPQDTLVYILSFKNIHSSPITGNLWLFYNSKVTQINALGAANTLPDYAMFNLSASLLYPNPVGKVYSLYQGLPTALGQDYKEVAVYSFTELEEEEEIHLFIELVVDKNMDSFMADTLKTQADFLAVATVGLNSQATPVVSADTRRYLDSLQFLALQLNENVFPSGTYFFDPGTDILDETGQSVGINNPGELLLLDAYTSTISFVQAHDPNYLQAYACACDEGAARKQVVIKVHCENEGFGHTSNVFIDMKLPAGITADDIVPTPVWVHPGNNPASVFFEKITADSIRWRMPNFLLFSKLMSDERDFSGVPDSTTFAEITFIAYYEGNPADLDSLQASVRFESIANPPVNTARVKAALLTDASSPDGLLSCGPCPDIKDSCVFPQWCAWPWWLKWLLALLIVVILIWWWRRANRS